MLESILKSIFSAGTFQQMLRSATPVAMSPAPLITTII